MEKIICPRGTADILPQDVDAWKRLEAISSKICKSYCYKEIRTPVFEEIGLFKRSLGQSSEVVHKQLLELSSNKGDNAFALRPEGTASIVRSYIQNGLSKKETVSKLFYIGPMFRGERPQKGRLRQFHQMGAEVIGPKANHPYFDIEVISLLKDLLNSFGLNDFVLKINNLGTEKDKSIMADAFRDMLEKDKNNLCEDCQSRFERNVFRVLDCKKDTCKSIVSKINFSEIALSDESRNYFDAVIGGLKDYSIDFEICPYLVRGLDYYTHTVFEVSYAGLGAQDAIGAGGRYNNLVAQLGGPEVSAIGFALGIERILLALEDQNKFSDTAKGFSIDAFIVTFPELFDEVKLLLNDLRQKRFSVDIDYHTGSFKSQMRQANKMNARYALIIGEDEWKDKMITVKSMESGEQEKVSIDKIEEFLKKG